jgi:N-acetylmuramic acid 6-phosphate etherase
LEPGGPCALDSDSVPEQFLLQLNQLHTTLKSSTVMSQLARLTTLEESTYRSRHKTNYYADRFGIDVLTDTTERSPTYCTPPFRKFDDTTASESWAFLFVSAAETGAAWQHILKHKPNCVGWSEGEVHKLVGEQKAERVLETIRKIGYPELMRFRIGLDGTRYRGLGPGDTAVGILSEEETSSLLSPTGFHRVQLESAQKAGANVGLIYFGGNESCERVSEFVKNWKSDCVAVLVPTPESELLLGGVNRLGVKVLLNVLSTCTMVRLGRVMGNFMIWVVASNLKLIDRATRYIQKLTGLGYRESNQLLFEVIEYVEPRMKADQAYPPVVGLAVTRVRRNIGNQDAEQYLASGLSTSISSADSCR